MKTTHALLVALALLVPTSCKKKEATEQVVKEGPSGPTTGAGTAAVSDPSAVDMAGAYTIKSASNPGGHGTYRGSVQVTKANGYYDLAWTITGSPGYAGVALQEGDHLGVGWGQGGDFGVVVYKIEGGKLSGTWTSHGAAGVGVEDLEGPASLSGTYKITKATVPGNGKSYSGDVVITPHGDTYLVHWKLAGGDSYDGAAIREGDRLVVGWGRGGKGAGVVSYTAHGKELDGKWATASGGSLGSEVLTK